jgi:hypothetical protein
MMPESSTDMLDEAFARSTVPEISDERFGWSSAPASSPGQGSHGSLAPVRLSSPILRRFESSPFRVLQIPIDVSVEAASLLAERQLTLARAGIDSAEGRLLPWLSEPDFHIIQQASQTIEEPLVRVVDQLFWFDLTRDPNSVALTQALSALSGDTLFGCLVYESELPAVTQASIADLGQSDAAAGSLLPEAPQGLTHGQLEGIAHAINQANLRMLAASALADGCLRVETAETGASPAVGDLLRTTWRPAEKGFRQLDGVHEKIGEALSPTEGSAPVPGPLWAEALLRWRDIIAHPWFLGYVEYCLTMLQDEYVQAGDAEVVIESLTVQLTDMYAREARFFLTERRYQAAFGVIEALRQSEIDPRILSQALRPLHHLFEAEIEEMNRRLDQVIDNIDGNVTDDSELPLSRREKLNGKVLTAHLKRIAVLKQRWGRLDPGGLLGLANFIDDAIEQAYLRVRREPLEPGLADTLYEQLTTLCSATSLRERISSTYRQIQENKEWDTCHYCKQRRPDIDSSVVLNGKKETGRTRSFNSETIHYLLLSRLVPRCSRCAKLHDFLLSVETAGGLSVLALVMPAVVYSLILTVPGAADTDVRFVLVLLFIAGLVCFIFYSIGSSIAGRIAFGKTTPKGYLKMSDYKGTDAERKLRAENYGITPNYHSTAAASMRKARNES